MNGEVIEHLDPSRHRYQLTDQLAWQELSVTYRARDLQSGTWVALRRVSPRVPLDSSALRRFEREFELLSSLRHPAVVRALEYGWDDGGPFYTTEYVEGRELIATTPLHWRTACANLRRLASALALLHTRGILHGRLSPSSVLVSKGGAFKLSELSTAIAIGSTAAVSGPYGAPEAASACLDVRADIYSLGALAFFALTGEHIAAQRADADGTEVPWVSAVVHDVPTGVDLLIRSMVHVDRELRPASMAEVIGRLSALAQLEPEPSAVNAQIAHSYLAVPPMHGQARALSILTGALASAGQGRGRALLLEGEGAGRLLDEVSRLARFDRWDVVRLGPPHASSEPGSAHDSAVRETAVYAAQATERLFPRLADPRQPPLLIVAEALDTCSPESLESYRRLASCAQGTRALFLLRDLAEPHAGEHRALTALRADLDTISVLPLTSAQTASLVRSMFGDVPRGELAARWLHEVSAGSPARVVRLAREMVEQGSARHLDGTWSLPTRRPATDVRPRGAAGMTAVEPALREAATTLTLLRAPPTVDLARSLLAHVQRERPERDSLDALIARRALIEDAGVLRFSSLALRAALQLEAPQAQRDLHRRLADAWLAHAPDPWCQVEAAFHLLEAGDSERGALLLARTAATYPQMHATRPGATFGDVFAAALQACPEPSAQVRLALLSGLAQAGVCEDFRWYRQYADHALAAVERALALGLARQLRPLFGASLALLIACTLAALRFWFSPPRRRLTSFARHCELAAATLLALLTAATSCLELERAQAIARVLEPLSVLRHREPVRTLSRLADGLTLLASDSPARSFEVLQEVLTTLVDPELCRGLSYTQRTTLAALTHSAYGLLAVHRVRLDTAEQSADYLARTGLPCFVSVARLIRQLAHAHRGDRAKAEAARHELERASPDPGASWLRTPWDQASLALPALSAGDPVELRQLAESLRSLARELPSLLSYQRLVEKAARVVEDELADAFADPQHALRVMRVGQHEGPVFEQRALIGSARVQATLASLMNAAGRHREAAATCAKVLARMEPGDEEFTALFLELELQHALARSGLGEEQAALAELEVLLGRVRDSGHPLVLARVHEVRAQVALAWSRAASFQRELSLAAHWYRATTNTTSLARLERLALRAAPAGHELDAPPPPRARKRA